MRVFSVHNGEAVAAIESALLQVARRADELVRISSPKPGLSLHCWLIAEREVLGAEFNLAGEWNLRERAGMVS